MISRASAITSASMVLVIDLPNVPGVSIVSSTIRGRHWRTLPTVPGLGRQQSHTPSAEYVPKMTDRGITFASTQAFGPAYGLELARQAEDLGYSSYWVAEATGPEA